MNIVYRQLKEGEYLMAAQLEQECLHTPWSEAQISNLPENACYIGAFEDTLCGIGSAYFVLDECQIMNIAVLPQYRRQGIGIGIIEELTKKSLEKGCGQIFLEVAEDNFSAISLYEKCGFNAVGKRKNFYGSVSAVIMEKIL